jgi:hypothetical protein
MSLYLRALFGDPNPTHGWVITRDYLAEGDPDDDNNVSGVAGPGEMSADAEKALNYVNAETDDQWFKKAKGYVFDMYDDDGEHYVRGRLWCPEFETGDEPDEDALASPLFDYGQAGMGCTRITYLGHPGWEIG